MQNRINSESHVLFVCEGTFEQVMVETLLAADAFVMSKSNVVGITRSRKASQVQEGFLNYDYDWPVTIVRIIDSRKEKFKLGKLYSDRYEVVNVHTRPEAEMLVIAKEGRFTDYAKHKSKMKPSEYCVQVLGMGRVKSREYLQDYWDAESLYAAAREYKRLQKLDKGEVCLADILK